MTTATPDAATCRARTPTPFRRAGAATWRRLRDQMKAAGVPNVGDIADGFEPSPHEVTDDYVRHSVRRFAEQYGPGIFGATIPRLQQLYERENSSLYAGTLPPNPLIVIAPHRALGWHVHRSRIGGQHEIGISLKLFRPGNKHLRISDDTAEHPDRFIDDVMRHEMVHLHNNAVLKEPEPSFHGHGPVFAQQCTRVGRLLGLTAVKSCRDRSKKNRGLPNCSSWPLCVRPERYYGDALITPSPDAEVLDEGEAEEASSEVAMQYLKRIAERVSGNPSESLLLAQAAVIAVRLRFGPEVLPGYSRDIPLSDILVI